MSNELDSIIENNNFFEIDTILQKKPTCNQIIKYYWIAITNNREHKMNYMKFKSRLHRTETIIDFFTKIKKEKEHTIEDTDLDLSYEKVIEDIFIRTEWVILGYNNILWCSRAPFENYLRKYVFMRNDILGLNQNYECEGQTKLEERTQRKLMKHTVYIAQELIIMSEFIKNDIDRNDDLLFKITIFVLNGLILVGQQLWNNYYGEDSI